MHLAIYWVWLTALGEFPQGIRVASYHGQAPTIALLIDSSDVSSGEVDYPFISNWKPVEIAIVDLTMPKFGFPDDRDTFSREISRSTALASEGFLKAKELRAEYVRKIQAHLVRRWSTNNPSMIELNIPECVARVGQSSTGDILAVALVNCPPDPRLRESLIDAISSAAPFPPSNVEPEIESVDISFTGEPHVSASITWEPVER